MKLRSINYLKRYATITERKGRAFKANPTDFTAMDFRAAAKVAWRLALNREDCNEAERMIGELTIYSVGLAAQSEVIADELTRIETRDSGVFATLHRN